MPKKSGTDNTKNTGSVKFSQTELYRKGIKESELKNVRKTTIHFSMNALLTLFEQASELRKPKTNTSKMSNEKLKEELPWYLLKIIAPFSSCVINALVVSRGVAVSILVVMVGSLIYLGYYSLQNMIDEENKKGL
jgi:hypothetical protein